MSRNLLSLSELQQIHMEDNNRLHLIRHFLEVDPAYLAAHFPGRDGDLASASLAAPGSKFLADFCRDPDELLAKIQRFAEANRVRAFWRAGRCHFTIHLPRRQYPQGVGRDGLVPIWQLSLAELRTLRHEVRVGSPVPVPTVIVHRAARTWFIHVILFRSAEGVHVGSIFPGSMASRLPNPATQSWLQLMRSRLYWSVHALVREAEA